MEMIDFEEENLDAEIKGLQFKLTCRACPEQYDVFLPSGMQVGYVRLRHGMLSADCPDYSGELVYDCLFEDGWKGCFDSGEERQEHLEKIADAIWDWIDKKVKDSE